MDGAEIMTLGNLGGGGAEEKFQREMKRILSNIQDPNTSHKSKRKIRIELEFETNEARTSAITSIKFKTTLAPELDVGSQMFLQTTTSGEVRAVEFNPKQMNIFEGLAEEDRPNKLMVLQK